MTLAELGGIDLNLLYTLHCIAQEGSITAAARVLARTQPAITSRVQQLERQLGLRLIQRRGRSIELTPIGQLAARHARTLVHGAQALLDGLRADQAAPAGTLRIGTLPTVSAFLLAPVLADYARAFPEVRLDIRTGLTQSHLEPLRQGELDVVITVGSVDWEAIEVQRLGWVKPVLTEARGSRRRLRTATLADLTGTPLIAYHLGMMGDPFFDSVWRFIERHGLRKGIRATVPHIQSIKALVARGAGVSILPDYTVQEPELATLPLRGLREQIPLSVAFRKGADRLPNTRELLKRLDARQRRRPRPQEGALIRSIA